MERINKLKAFLLQQPNDSFLQHALALEYIKIGDDDEARLLFENILGHYPSYVCTYYHLSKLIERQKEFDGAITVYEKGITAAKQAGDNHAKNELQMALDEIVD